MHANGQGIYNVPFFYSAYHIQIASICAWGIITPALAPCSLLALIAFEGINSCWVPIYYTSVERDNCGQNTLSRGIRTEWDSNQRPSDYKSRARTTEPHVVWPLIHSFFVLLTRINGFPLQHFMRATKGKFLEYYLAPCQCSNYNWGWVGWGWGREGDSVLALCSSCYW